MMAKAHRIRAVIEKALMRESEKAAAVFVNPENYRPYSCVVGGCVRPAYAKRLCNGHYLRMRKGADMRAPLRARKRHDLCSQCGELAGAKGGWGLCQGHYKLVRYMTIKDAAIAALGGKCARCDGVFPREVFDFHHAGEKTENPSEMLLRRSVEIIAYELAKCILLCANCHRMEHRNELRRSI